MPFDNHGDGSLGGNMIFVHFARTFGEFLLKVAHYKDLYATPEDELFWRELRELNPSAEF